MSPSGETPDAKPDLHLVPDVENVAEARPTAPADNPGGATPEPSQLETGTAPGVPSSSYFSWILFGAALLLAWLWLTQLEKANGLAADLAGLRGELAAAKSDIVAWEFHGAQVQSGVEGLAAQLGALQELLDAAPTSGTELAPDTNSAPALELEAAPRE